jgi:serine/threonine protein kinase
MFFLMDYIDGGDLQTWMADERLYAGVVEEQQQRLVEVSYQVACGVRHLHRKGILHQDIKPTNVLMTASGKPVLADFGSSSQGFEVSGVLQSALRGLTPVFASPYARSCFSNAKALPSEQREQYLTGNPLTYRDDFWALGATIVEMFAECGWRQGKTDELLMNGELLTQMQRTDDVALARVPMPEGVVRVLSNACFCSTKSSSNLGTESIVEQMWKYCATNLFALTSSAYTPSQPGLERMRCNSIRNNLAMALIADDQYDGARLQLERAVESDSDDARSCNNLGVVFHKQGKLLEAKRHYKNALRVKPEHREAKANLRMLHRNVSTIAEPQLDATGVELALKDGSSNISLKDALRFGPTQKVCLRDDHQMWRECDVVGTPAGGSVVSYAGGGQELLTAPPFSSAINCRFQHTNR